MRNDPALYENNHVTQSWQTDVRHRSTIRQDWRLSYGLEGDGDAIDSNNLGHHSRNRGAGYLNLDWRTPHSTFLTVGAREEVFSGIPAEFVPAVAAGISIKKQLRLRASASRGFRLPTYTDLYYTDPANIGNPLLKPESAWDFEGGPEWTPNARISFQLTVFNRQEHDDIDYVRSSSGSPWKATNINYASFFGVETAIRFQLSTAKEIQLAYTELHASQQVQPGLTSEYVFNYPSNNASFSWIDTIKNFFTVRTRVGATQRVGHTAYALWDLDLSRSIGRVRPYLQCSNLSNTGYEEIPGVAMPGRSIAGGVELVLTHHR